MRPKRESYPDYYENYIPLVKENDVLSALRNNEKETIDFFSSVNPELEAYSYEKGKWSIKEVLNHLIDTERIFSYRALRFARKDAQQPLPFEQDDYVANAELTGRSLKDLIHEFETVRRSSISLFESFHPEALERIGTTAAGKASVNAIGFTICGHNIHHMKVVRERYLKK
jgi:uncharacterized damage-inducible protein DinB